MPISEASATALCREVVQSLTQWRTFPALLQVGGIESRGGSRILLALEKWLDTFAQERDLLILPEYRLSPARPVDETTDKPLVKAADQLFGGGRIDYALVSASSVGEAVLRVDTVLEVKTNYLGQADLRWRPKAACDQARSYAEACGASDVYVLYIVAAAKGKVPSAARKDGGWRYWNPRVEETNWMDEVRVLGCYPTDLPRAVQGDNDFQVWAYLLAP